MSTFSYLSYGAAKTEVALRLGDENMVFWSDAEIGIYILESLRCWNALTSYWAANCTLDLAPPFTANWFAANGAGSPRQQTLLDTDVYTLIEYHLLEPPTGGMWTGTNQYSINDLSQAMSRRRNEILQAAGCNMSEYAISLTPNTSTVMLSDLVLDVRRVRWVPVTGNPVTLMRGDSRSFQYFSPSYQQTEANPLRWDVIGQPPQTIAVDTLVNLPSVLQVLGMQGAADFAPPTGTLLLIPDDWMWVLKFGAMADVLSKEQEGKDIARASYCRKRYEEGLKLVSCLPWLLQGFINNVAVDTQPIAGADRFNYEWQSRSTAYSELVVGGTDLFAVSPIPTGTVTVGMTVVGNAPVPSSDTDEIQVPRDVMNAILAEAQHLALFKCGGTEFSQSMALHQEFVGMAMRQNKRLRDSGILATTIRPPVPEQQEEQPR